MRYLKGRLTNQPGLSAHTLVAFSCLLLLLITGCVSNKVVDQPTHLDLRQFKTATIEVKSDGPKQSEDLNQYKLRLETRIIAALRKEHVFENVYPVSDAPSELKIVVTITRLRDVSLTKRQLVGALAGPAKAEATLEFQESATGKVMGSCRFDKDASFNNAPFSVTAEAVDHLADAIIPVILHNL